MNITTIVGFSIVCVTVIVLLRKHAQEFAIPASVISSSFILLFCVILISGIFEKISEISNLSSVTFQNLKIIFKSLGICYITQLGTDVCKDCGENALADKVDLAGKVTIVTMSLSIITQVVELISEIVKL